MKAARRQHVVVIDNYDSFTFNLVQRIGELGPRIDVVRNDAIDLAGLRKILGLQARPRNIEGIDIAHLGGDDTVASLVQFIDGLPFKPGYRRFRIRTVEGVDDYASIREVVMRRFRRMRDSEQVMPDILLIDGGKGQLNAALEALVAEAVAPDVARMKQTT